MKRAIILILALVLAVPTMATMPAGSYDEELYARDKSTTTVKPQFEANVGFITGGKLNTKNFGKVKTNLSRPYLELLAGVRLGDFLFAGVGTGVQYAYGECNLISVATDISGKGSPETWGSVSIPIYANVRGYIPTRIIVKPYISVSIGGHVVATSNFSQEGYGKLRGGLLMKFGAGMNIANFNFALGLASQNLEWIDTADMTMFKAGNNAFYIEVGATF
ncbi:MAG: hypothetical protein IJ464_03025 [Alistipes sp.]|nr:hypothetical protein [Alistipes sp.]